MSRNLRRRPRRVRWIRHGYSQANDILKAATDGKENCFHLPCPEIEIPLVDKGFDQADALAAWLWELPKEDRPSAIVSSQYRRACQTKVRINRKFGNRLRSLEPMALLNERNWGIFSGITEFGVKNIYPDEARLRKERGEFVYRPRGGESRRDIMRNRLRPALDYLFEEAAGEDLAIVVHSEIILCGRKMMEGLTEAEACAIHAQHHVPNCSMTSYVWNGRRWRLEGEAYFVAPSRNA